MSDDATFGFADIQPNKTRREPADMSAIDRTGEDLGFVSREASAEHGETTTIQRKPKPGPSGPVGQFNLRAAVADVNEFIDWCGRERMSYREGFGKLMDLKRQTDRH